MEQKIAIELGEQKSLMADYEDKLAGLRRSL